MSNTDVIDRNVLNSLVDSFGGDLEFLGELLQIYFTDAPQQIATMHAAAAACDAETLRRAAHSMKSNSANFGAMALSEQCKDLEMLARAGTLAGTPERVAAVTYDYELVRAALEAIQAGN